MIKQDPFAGVYDRPTARAIRIVRGREEELVEPLGEVLTDIHSPDDLLALRRSSSGTSRPSASSASALGSV
jgi:hypothetical protein